MDIGALIAGLTSIIPKIFYTLCMGFLSLIDLIQFLFRRFAGLDTYYIEAADGSLVPQEGDVVFTFLKNILFSNEYPLLSNVFWSMLVLGIILLFVSTIIAIIRKDYTYDRDSAKGPIVGKAIKSLAYMAMVPIIVLFGVYLTNTLLKAVDQATAPQNQTSFVELDTKYLESYMMDNGTETYVAYDIFGLQIPTTSTPFSSYIFEVCANGANRVRLEKNEIGGFLGVEDTEIGEAIGMETYDGFYGLLQANEATNFSGFFTADTPEECATIIDEAFMGTVKLDESYAEKLNFSNEYISQNNPLIPGFSMASPDDITVRFFEIQTFDKSNVGLVWYYYNLWNFNYLIAVGAALMFGITLFNITIGMLGRIVEMIALFIVYAPLLGIAPMDNEKAFNNWRGRFIKKTLMVFGAVAGMNLVFILLPYIGAIKFFGEGLLFGFANGLVTIMLIFVLFTMVKGFIGMISEFVNGENPEEYGKKIGGELGQTMVKAGTGLAKTVGLAALPVAAGVQGARLAGGAIKGLRAARATNKGINTATLAAEGARRKRERNAKALTHSSGIYQNLIDQEAENNLRNSSEKTATGLLYSKLTDEQWEQEKLTEAYKSRLATERTSVASGGAMHSGKTLLDLQRSANKQGRILANQEMEKMYDRADWDKVDGRELRKSYFQEMKEQGLGAMSNKDGRLGGFVGMPTKMVESYWKFIKEDMSKGDGLAKSLPDLFNYNKYMKEMNLPYLSEWAKAKVEKKQIDDLVREHEKRMEAEGQVKENLKKKHPEWYN